jgi:hypothetical protein
MVGPMRVHRLGMTPPLWLLVLFGLDLCLGEKSTLRGRTLTTDQRNTYWDLPADRTHSSNRLDNPYWQLPSHAVNNYDDELETDGGTITMEAAIQEIDKFVPALSTTTVAERENKMNDSLEIISRNIFLEQCLELLESHADDEGRVNKKRYMSFLQELSNDTFKPGDFTDLPLFLAMIFFSASCSSGEDCVDLEPAITIHPPGTVVELDMNQVLCNQLMRFPFMEVLLPFQFLVRLDSGLSASELILMDESKEANEVSQILPTLEGALDQVLLRGFNCSYVPGEPTRHKHKKKERMSPHRRSQFRQPQPQNDCDYVVDVTVEDAADYRKYDSASVVLSFVLSISQVLTDSIHLSLWLSKQLHFDL